MLLALLAGPALAGDVKAYTPKEKVDYQRYRTYQWNSVRLATKAGIVEEDAVVAPLIRAAVNKQLAAKGMTLVESGGDLVINAAGVATGMYQVEGWMVTFGFDAYWWYGFPMVAEVNRYNKEGTLVVVLVDASTKKGVWAGFATEAVGKESMVPGAVEKAAQRLFKKFPRKP